MKRKLKMQKPAELRKFYRWNFKTKHSTKVNPRNLKPGDVFQIYEPDSVEPIIVDGSTWFIVNDTVKKVSAEKGYVIIPCFDIKANQSKEAIK